MLNKNDSFILSSFFFLDFVFKVHDFRIQTIYNLQ